MVAEKLSAVQCKRVKFTFQFSFLCYDSDVVNVWSDLGTKTTWLGLGKDVLA